MKTNQKTNPIITVEMLLSMLDFFPHSIYLKDIEGKFIWVNTVKANHYGLEPKDMIGKTDFDFLPADEAFKCFEDDQQVMATGIPIIGRIEELTRPDGQKVFQSATKIAIKDDEGKTIGTFGASRDVTKSVMREKEVLAIVGLASHDIRSSLNSMIINLGLMHKDRFGTIGISAKKVLEEILTTGNRLMSKTNEILRQATIEGMKIDEQQIFDLREEVLDPVLLEIKDDLDEMEIFVDNSLGSIPTETIGVRLGNAVLVKQVLLDLCKNALKHVEKGGTIAFGFEDIGEFFKLNVYNDGPPVPDNMRDAIFEEFTSGTGSTGVGLPLARKVIRMLGGDLWYEESLDKHPNFVFTLKK